MPLDAWKYEKGNNLFRAIMNAYVLPLFLIRPFCSSESNHHNNAICETIWRCYTCIFRMHFHNSEFVLIFAEYRALWISRFTNHSIQFEIVNEKSKQTQTRVLCSTNTIKCTHSYFIGWTIGSMFLFQWFFQHIAAYYRNDSFHIR